MSWHDRLKRPLEEAGRHKWITFIISVLVVLLVVISTFGLFWNKFLDKNNTPSRFRQDIIYQENQKEGTTQWEIKQPSGSWADRVINGYADNASINHGESVGLYISTSQKNYNLEVYRMGWYGGNGARLMLTVRELPGQNQPSPEPQVGSRLIAANWKLSFMLQTRTDWVSGAYLVKLVTSDGSASYIFFVLRDDESAADILYQIPVTTYQAYNDWGGNSLYDYNSNGMRAYKVSFDRPYAASNGAGYFFIGDFNMIRWLESHDYDVSYATSIDTQVNPRLLNNHKVFLTNYHDEYWSQEMRRNVTSALNAGKNLAFFAANSIYWQIRFEASGRDRANRVIVCYKDAKLDPIRTTDPALTTVNWRAPIVNLPENALLGAMYKTLFVFGASYPWIVENANHWIYNGTGLQNGDSIPGLIGYEVDGIWNNGLTPKHLVVLSSTLVVKNPNDTANVESGEDVPNFSYANATIYTAPSGALVFDAGTMYWSWKLDDNDLLSKVADPRVQRMTANLLDRMIGVAPL